MSNVTDPSQFPADYILLTHGHADHVSDAGQQGIDLAVLPIGDNFTMGPADALRAVKLIEPRVVIPIHYDTFDVIAQDPHTWADQVRAETCVEPVVLKLGESYEL